MYQDDADTRDIFSKHLTARSLIDNACCAKDRLVSSTTPNAIVQVMHLTESPAIFIVRFPLKFSLIVIMADFAGENSSRFLAPHAAMSLLDWD